MFVSALLFSLLYTLVFFLLPVSFFVLFIFMLATYTFRLFSFSSSSSFYRVFCFVFKLRYARQQQ